MSIRFLSILILFFSFSVMLFGQSEEKEKSNPVDQLWYGLNIGGIGLGGNSLGISLAPMGGYKINEHFALGLTVKLDYIYEWYAGLGSYHNLNYGGGVFGRVKLFRKKYFAQIEYDQINYSLWDGFERDYYKEWLPFVWIGAGALYPSNGKYSSEILVLYNFNPTSRALIFPWSFNYAFTYNF